MTTYSISLDDVDLALLPLPHKYSDFLKKEHYTFEVLKTAPVDEPEPTIFYKCHICAIDVPAAFANEHAASVKHRANARIASVAATRTRALISATPPPATPQPAQRFCANCAIIVGNNHEKTKEHRVAVMHDKLLWELMLAYVGDDRKDDDDSDLSETDDFKEHEVPVSYNYNYNKYATCNHTNGIEKNQSEQKSELIGNKKEIDRNTVKAIINQNYNDSNRIENKTTNNAVDNIKIKQINRKEEKLKQDKDVNIKTNGYISTETENNEASNTIRDETEKIVKTDQAVAPTNTTKGTQDKIEYVEYITKGNKVVKVFSDHYHSFTRKGETVSCIVCGSVFYNEEVDSHIFSLKHLNQMPSTMIDEHGVRKINDTYSHCILCNQLVKQTNVAKHYLTIAHSLREKQAIIENKNKTYSEAIIAKKPAKLAVSLAPNDKAILTAELKERHSPKEETSNIDWPVIYPYELGKEGCVRCIICDCNVPNHPDNRKQHLLGLNHVKNVRDKRFNKYPFEETMNNDVYRCAACDAFVRKDPDLLADHLYLPGHAEEAENMGARYPYVVIGGGKDSRCVICDVKLPNFPFFLLLHYQEHHEE